MKAKLCTILGVVGATIAGLLGGWDAGLKTLMACMVIDYVSGIVVAGVFHNSKKSKNGSLKSTAGWKGLCKKGMTILILYIACKLDAFMGTNYIRNTVIVGYIVNEIISILENAGLMGVPIPNVIKNAIDILQTKEGKNAE